MCIRDRLFSAAFKRQRGGYGAREVFERHAAKASTDDPLALIQYLDLKTYLVGDINTKVDRASMAHSLEVREPLMDHPLVEWLATLPSNLKVKGREGKLDVYKRQHRCRSAARPVRAHHAERCVQAMVGRLRHVAAAPAALRRRHGKAAGATAGGSPHRPR